MGVRLQGEYRSTGRIPGEYTLVTVQIIDTASGDTQHPVTFTEGGVTFNLSGEQRSLHGRFASMTATFEIIMDHSEVDDFAAALGSHDEERFFVKIGINGVVRFIGILTADGDQWEDIHRDANPILKLIAMDGMGRISGKNYADENDAVYSGYETMEKIIWKCLKNSGTTEHFAGQPFFAILHDNVEDSQAVNGDPFNNQRVNQDIFHEKAVDTGTYNFKSAREVLSYICVAYNLCLKYIGPYYLFYNPQLLPGSAYAYDIDGEPAGTVSTGSTLTINDDKLLDANRKGIGHFGVIPPLHRARITYDHGPQDVNMLFGVSYSGDNIGDIDGLTMLDLGPITIAFGEVVILRFSGKLRTKSHFSEVEIPRWHNHRYHFRIYIKLEASPYPDRWWNRVYDAFDFYSTSWSNYGNPEFIEGVAYFDFVTDIIDSVQKDINIFKMVGFDTTPLFSDTVTNVSFGLVFVRVFDEKLETLDDTTQNPVLCEWEWSDLELVALENGTILKRPTKTVSEGLGNPKNSYYQEEVTLIGDGPMKSSNSRIQVNTGSEWKDSKLWDGLKLHRKSVKNIAEARTESLRLLLGGFYALNFWFDSVISYNGVDYFAMSLQYRTGSDEWEGEMVEIGNSGSGITTKEKRVLVKERVPLPENPNRLPDDEALQDRILKIVTTEAHTPSGGPYTVIGLRDPAKYDYLFRKGDVVNIIDPVIGYTNELTVALDVRKNDTTLTIESWIPDEDFPPGSYIELERLYELANREKWIYQRNLNFIGSDWDIVNDGDYEIDEDLLPDETEVLDQDYSVMVYVFKSGQKLMYKVNISTDTEYHKGFYSTKALDQVHFYEPCTGQPIEIYIKLINK